MTPQHVLFFVVILGTVFGAQNPEHTVPHARTRLYSDFIQKLYAEISAAQIQNRANMIQIFTQGTLEQEQEVARYIQSTVNSTKSESNTMRMAANSSMEITECIYQTELSLLQVFLTTYENFDSCVKSTQKAFERLYNEINVKLEKLKKDILSYYQATIKTVGNCADSDCVVKTLVASVMKYELSKEHLANEIKAFNDLNVNYLVKNIAMKCVSSSLGQIHHNFNIGNKMMAACFHKQQPNQNRNQPNNYEARN